MIDSKKVVEVEPSVKQLGDEPKVTLHLDRDPNDPRVPKGTVLQSFRKGDALEVLQILNSKEIQK